MAKIDFADSLTEAVREDPWILRQPKKPSQAKAVPVTPEHVLRQIGKEPLTSHQRIVIGASLKQIARYIEDGLQRVYSDAPADHAWFARAVKLLGVLVVVDTDHNLLGARSARRLSRLVRREAIYKCFPNSIRASCEHWWFTKKMTQDQTPTAVTGSN